MRILGLSAYYHDSAAALVVDGVATAAAQEERFSRKKHDSRFPQHAVRYCLESQGLTLADLDAVVYYEKPLLTFERLLETYLGAAPRGGRCQPGAAGQPSNPDTNRSWPHTGSDPVPRPAGSGAATLGRAGSISLHRS